MSEVNIFSVGNPHAHYQDFCLEGFMFCDNKLYHFVGERRDMTYGHRDFYFYN